MRTGSPFGYCVNRAAAAAVARLRNEFEPYTRCKPSGGARQVATAYGTQFVEMPELQRFYIFQTGGPRSYRVVYMDGRDHPEDLTPSYYGHSIGRWEGDTLVVDTVGFNERMWIDREGDGLIALATAWVATKVHRHLLGPDFHRLR